MQAQKKMQPYSFSPILELFVIPLRLCIDEMTRSESMSLFHDMASIIPLPVGERGGTKSSLDRSGPMSPKAFHFLSSGESAFSPPVEANATTLSVFLRLDLFYHADNPVKGK